MIFPPIIFLAYNRPEHTAKVLESLARNPESSESDLHCFLDKARNEKDIEKNDAVLGVIKGKQWAKNVFVHKQKENMGCAGQLIQAMDNILSNSDSVIVVEDDNLLSPFFLRYMSFALDKYCSHDNVAEITGYQFPLEKEWDEPQFCRLSCGWGWGTYSRTWNKFEKDGGKLLQKILELNKKKEFDLNGTYPHMDMLKKQMNGEIGGWDIRWYANSFIQDTLTLYPGKSLVKNIGFDGTGLNALPTSRYDTNVSKKPIQKFPAHVLVSEEFQSHIDKYFYKYRPKLSKRIMGRLLRN